MKQYDAILEIYFFLFLYLFLYPFLHVFVLFLPGGGLADWYPTYLLRYTNATIDQAGLIVGAATIIGGIGGNILGEFDMVDQSTV